jgi:polysaccharide deacetylase 2 family uncharacterized protein YibQ
MTAADDTGGAGARPVSYRGLIVFWIAVVLVVGVGAGVLQALGPVRPGEYMAARKPLPAGAPAPEPARAAQKTVAAPDAALLEPAPDLPGRFLPLIGPNNRVPAVVYAAPFDAADKHPRVALIVAGAGLDQDLTLHLLNDVPGPVDVAFSAYMPEQVAEQMAARAQATGHECLLSIPMEPSGYPLTEEGKQSLLTGGDDEQNRQNLEWALSRLGGCVGATGASDGMMGERFAQTARGFSDMLTEVTRRGLLYLDPRTGAPALITAASPNVRVADMIVDQAPNPEDPVTADLIDQRLAALERLALERGAAIGLAGPPKPVLLERIAVWAHGLAARGVTLAPLTAMPAPAGGAESAN